MPSLFIVLLSPVQQDCLTLRRQGQAPLLIYINATALDAWAIAARAGLV
jgi:hypothetical protein